MSTTILVVLEINRKNKAYLPVFQLVVVCGKILAFLEINKV